VLYIALTGATEGKLLLKMSPFQEH